MTNPLYKLALVAAVAAACVPAAAVAAARPSPTSRPAGDVVKPVIRPAPKNGEDKDAAKYKPASEAQIAANRKLAVEWFEKARKEIAPALHQFETEHFLIFSSYPKTDDAPIGRAAEKLYDALCRQFSVPGDQNIFAGKCPIYAFATKDQFVKFGENIDKCKLSLAAGYASQRSDGFCYMVFNQVNSKQWFYELLTHEGTHAYLGRYLSNRHIVAWVNEGLADLMAATLVPGSQAEHKYVTATAEVLRKNLDVSHVYEKIELNAIDYGVAQSLVRFLIARDRKAFVQFVTLMKEGKSDEAALQETYSLTKVQLMDAWRKAAAKALTKK